MRVAFIGGFAFSPKGTIPARALPLAAELVKQGHEVTIFLTPYDNPADSGREREQNGVRICNMRFSAPARARSITGLPATLIRYSRLLISLVSAVSRFRPDLIHVFKPKGFAGAAGSYFLLKGRSIVLDCDDWEGWEGWNEVKSYPWIVKEYIDRQERWMVRMAPAVTVASRALQERAQALRGSQNGIYYVPNCALADGSLSVESGVRSQFLSETRRELRLPGGPIILYSGHFDAAEDTDLFCRAAALVVSRHTASILFVGDGPRLPHVREFFSNRPELKASFYPQLPYDKFLQLVSASDIAAFPYRDDAVHRAKCSARIVDYMTMGKAVLTSAVGQNCEYIVDGESGILCRPGDELHFSEKLELLLGDSELRLKLGERAKQQIQQRFRWDGDALSQCLAAYEQVTKTHLVPAEALNV